MMRSDMPKQIMAYRNGGGLPSLATAPMEFSNGGGIGSFVSNAYNKAVGAVKNALGMNDDKSYAPELTTQPGPESNQMSAKEKFDSNPARQASVRSKKRRKKRRARQAAAEAAAAAAAAEQQAAATATVDQGIGTLDTNVDVANAYIENMVAGRDDLSDLEKLDFANQLAQDLGVVGGSGQQAAIDNVLNTALDPTSGLDAQTTLDYLNAAGDTTGVYETGLIDTLTSNISAAEQLAAEQAAAEAAAAAQAQADQLAAEQAAAAAAQAEQEAAAAAAAAAAQAQADQLAAQQAAANQFSLSGAGYGTYNTNPITSGQPITTSTNYAPIVPSSNVNTAGIAGLPSTGMSNVQPYTFTAYTPGAYTPAVNPLILPPLG